MTADGLKDALATAGLAVDVSPEALSGVEAYLTLRARWSKTHNLAGPQARRDPWRVDVVDSLAVLAVLEPSLPLIDVGAGSGTPGLIIAIARPELAVHLVEPLSKRVAFLRTAIHRLGLQNVTVTRARWPIALTAPSQVVSRAVVSPDDWPALAASAGPAVHAILRCLAAQRPAVDLADFGLGARMAYDLGDGGARLVERWDRKTPA